MSNFLKEQYYIVEGILAVVLILFIALFAQTYYEKNNMLTSKNIEIENLNKRIESCNEQIEKLGKNEKQQEINNNIMQLQNQKQDLETQKTQLETEINTLKGEVIKAKGQPKTYPAGHLTAGTDVPVGKYKIYGGSSNFIVYSAYGTLEVNIILGGTYGVNEYIYTFQSGDKIQASSSFNLVEVE